MLDMHTEAAPSVVAPLNERIARDDLAVKQLAFYADPNAETEAAMLRARDNWTEAHQAVQAGGR